MQDPIELGKKLKGMYLRYIESRFQFRYKSVMEERRALLSEPGCLYQPPVVEAIPAYRPTDRNFREESKRLNLPAEFADFSKCGLFDPDHNIYQHQSDAIDCVVNQKRDIVVTTGTGSGKTECYLLPIFAQLVRESADWPDINPRKNGWDWWNQEKAERIPQRHNEAEERPVAMRALILYPLNALVEDQMRRLRNAIDSDAASKWFEENRGDNRFYFGRYTGNTPVSGKETPKKREELKKELQELDNEYKKACSQSSDDELRYYFSSLHGGEMVSRWDMQKHPPDILITNYSMLNIMLMRKIEEGIFERTRKWLESDREKNIFHLVVDELHTYRGTQGSEVAYLLRLFLDRLGLKPSSPQLRIIGHQCFYGRK